MEFVSTFPSALALSSPGAKAQQETAIKNPVIRIKTPARSITGTAEIIGWFELSPAPISVYGAEPDDAR
jgi:hypothetical protein